MIFSGKYKWTFVPQTLEEDTSEIINPSRGWYEIYSFSIVEDVDFEELKWCLRDNQTLALLLVDLGDVADDSLNENHLENLDRILDFFGKAKKDIILRLTYDRQGRGMVKEPSSFLQILAHIKQLGEILRKHRDVIFTYQGLLVGNWGEMHGSAYLSQSNIKTLANVFYEATGKENYLAVRKPQQWRYIFEDGDSDGFARHMGLFDDGMFGSESDLGTFGVLSRKNAEWEDSWKRDDEIKFESIICENAPNGGEAVLGKEIIPAMKAIDRLKAMKITYLNCAYDIRLLDKWKMEIFKSEDEWSGISCYDYISRHLGYRIVVDNVIIKKKAVDSIEAVIKFRNNGFAPLYDEIFFELLVVTNDGNLIIKKHEHEDRIRPDIKYEIKILFPVNTGRLYIRMKRKKDCRNITFANYGSDENGLYLGDIV